ncbi:MAG: leucine-rich repeat domain-containing protein [Acutalibacteraceae bacterium]
MKKRLLVSLCSGFMLCLAAQSAVWADTTPITGTDLQWEISDNALTISKNEDGQTGETAIPDCNGNTNQPWKDNISAITSVTIGAGVTGIGKDAFFQHEALEYATIGADVTSIGQMAFKNTGLTSIDLKNVKTIGNSAFSGCTGLTSINLKGVETIGDSAFKDCTNLTDIEFGDVKTIGDSAFNGCTSFSPSSYIELPCSTTVAENAFDEGIYTSQSHQEFEDVQETPATCTTPEIVAHKKCEDCGKLFISESTFDSFDEKPEVKSRVQIGQTLYLEVDESVLEKGDPLAYALNFVPAKEATCTQKGNIDHFVCTTCGKTFVISQEGEVVNPPVHFCSYSGVPYACAEIDNVETDYGPHQYGELIEKVPATCTKNGCEAHYECEVCGGKFVIVKGEDGTETYKEVDGKDLIIPATGHSYGEWEITKAPTTTSEGEKTRKCSICDSAETDVIPKLAEEKTSGVVSSAATTSGVVSSAATTYGYAVDTGDFVSGEMLAYAYSLCVSGMAFVSLRKKKSKV